MTLQEYKNTKMKDPEFAKAYEDVQPEMEAVRVIVDARISLADSVWHSG